jgi:hypothetical protein
MEGVPADIEAIYDLQDTLAFLTDTIRDLNDCLDEMIEEMGE